MIQPQGLWDQLAILGAAGHPLLALTPQQLTNVIAKGIDEGSKPSATDWWQVWLTFGGLLVSIVANLLLYRLAVRSARSSEQSAADAKSSAESAAAAQRPRLTVLSMTIQARAGENPNITEYFAIVTLRNNGPTGAEITGSNMEVGFELTSKSEEGFLRYPWRHPGRSHNPLPKLKFGELVDAQQHYRFEQFFYITDDMRQLASSGWPHQIVLRGYVSYKDYFDEQWVKGFAGLMDWHIPGIGRDLNLLPAPGEYNFNRRGHVDHRETFIPKQ